MHKPESILENKTHKFLWDFDVQTDYLIPARKLDLVIINKKGNLLNCGICHPTEPLSENQRKQKREKYSGLKLKNTMENKGDGDYQ